MGASPTIHKEHTFRNSVDEENLNKKVFNIREKIRISSKLKYQVLNFLEGSIFRKILFTLILLDFCFLCLDRFPISSEEAKFMYLADFIIFWFFFVEITSRLIIYGKKFFYLSNFNTLDFFIIFINLNQYIYEFFETEDPFYRVKTYSGCFCRISKLLRIFRFYYYDTFFLKTNLITKTVFKTMHKIKYFLACAMIIGITYALIGEELFAYRFHLKEGDETITPRVNFNTFLRSYEAIILAYFIEDWNVTVYEGHMCFENKIIIFYMFLVIIGQMTIAILLKALILNYFIKAIPKQFFEQTKALTYLKSKLKNLQTISKKNKITPTGSLTKLHNSRVLGQVRGSEIVNKSISLWKEESKFPLMKTYTSNLNLKKSRMSLDIHGFPAKNFRMSFELPNIMPKNKEHSSRIIDEPNAPTFSNLANKDVEEKEVKEISNESPKTPKSPNRRKTLSSFENYNRNSFQKLFFKILNSKYYQYFMFLVTVFSMKLQILDSKFDEPNCDKQKIIESCDKVLGVIYMIEIIMNKVTYGLIFNENSYLRQDFFNKLDFLNMIITIIDFFVDKYEFRLFQTLKIVRTFRLLKIAAKTTEEIQLISKAFIQAFPNLILIWFFFTIFLTIFSVLVTHYLKGSLFHCVNYENEIKIINKWDCLDNGGDWIDQDINYNNVFNSMLSLFQISSSQGWKMLMEQAIDGKGIDQQPVLENSPISTTIFFLIFYFISNFILLNMFVGIISENIIINKNKSSEIFCFFLI